MTRIRVKNYFYAGLDFIFDREENPWFLEANAAPGGTIDYETVYGKNPILEKVAEFMKSKGKTICIIGKRKEKHLPGIENSLWIASQLNEHIDTLHFCCTEDNGGRKNRLIDKNGNIVYPDCVFRSNEHISPAFENSIIVINPQYVSKITKNKLRTIKAIKNTQKTSGYQRHSL